MSVRQPTELELRDSGSLKWTGIKTSDGQDTFGAWVAEMDFGTAPCVQHALISSIEHGLLGYPPSWSGENTVDTLVRFLERRTGWEVKPEWVRPYASVLSALHTTIQYLTRPGSPVIVPTPAYMPFLTIPGVYDRELIEVPSIHRPEAKIDEPAWFLDLEGIEEGLRAGAGLVILCNPWNPTGRVLTVEELVAFEAVVSKYDAIVFSDEIHAPLVYGDPSSMVSYASLGPKFAQNTVTAVAASKAWNVAGLPAAQIIIPDQELRQRWDRAPVRDHPTTLGSVAAIAAYTDGEEWLAEVLEVLSTNLDILDRALDGTAVDYHRPQGTYLTWLGFDAYDLERSPHDILLNDYRLATNQGTALGTGFENWVRVNAAMPTELWKQTVDRIAKLANDE